MMFLLNDIFEIHIPHLPIVLQCGTLGQPGYVEDPLTALCPRSKSCSLFINKNKYNITQGDKIQYSLCCQLYCKNN